jgi:hypothetical protein
MTRWSGCAARRGGALAEATCRKVRTELVDARGRGESLSPQTADHLRSCPECAGLAVLLVSLAASTAAQAPPDYELADRARAILERRLERGRFVLFVLAAVGVVSALATAGILGYGLFVLAFQGTAFLTLPFVGLRLVRQRLKRATA